ncbi:ornithine cyclodeaminase [Aquicoccus porphyridii]|uniref:Ornithine cyclodeaminase n=1 Tax=Aquicoccus porphyridii TaxID=1852029 RepID=A0A5A9ZKC9_9RHOB|nr:NAD(P)-binding domain-containing protein [Aquicoccus porphyridii]KAA0917628.1 ornithine cyclodeaminase [Aquicoccus porphyridii]RAI55702.1 ornithine cyclodeaminase [Rhodobacteraceae bacterium AsT-22]
MDVTMIPFAEGEKLLDWVGLTRAFEDGHKRPKAEIGDTFLYRDPDTLLNRAAWIDGMGIAVKSATIFPGNPAKGKPMIGGAVNLYNDADGRFEAIVDFHLVTKWKTAGDSLLAAMKLARKDSRKVLIVGAGTVGRSLREAYGAGFSEAEFTVWNRTRENAEKMAAEYPGMRVADDLEAAVAEADIVTSATMSTEPVLRGEWFRPGQHIDLIGAYRPDMREVDDATLQRARVFVDSFDTTVGHIGEIRIPLESGAIRREDLVADYYEMEKFTRASDDEITLFKNGGGAHLDLMTSRYILDAWRAG